MNTLVTHGIFYLLMVFLCYYFLQKTKDKDFFWFIQILTASVGLDVLGYLARNAFIISDTLKSTITSSIRIAHLVFLLLIVSILLTSSYRKKKKHEDENKNL